MKHHTLTLIVFVAACASLSHSQGAPPKKPTSSSSAASILSGVIGYSHRPTTGDAGRLPFCGPGAGFKVFQVVDDNNVLGEILVHDEWELVWIQMPTAGMVDGRIVKTAGTEFVVDGTKKYQAALGQRTVASLKLKGAEMAKPAESRESKIAGKLMPMSTVREWKEAGDEDRMEVATALVLMSQGKAGIPTGLTPDTVKPLAVIMEVALSALLEKEAPDQKIGYAMTRMVNGIKEKK